MHTAQHQEKLQSKQRLRSEISSQIEDFLHRGGRIEVVNALQATGEHSRPGYWPAAADYAFVPTQPGE